MDSKSKFRQHLRTHNNASDSDIIEKLTDLPVNQDYIASNTYP